MIKYLKRKNITFEERIRKFDHAWYRRLTRILLCVPLFLPVHWYVATASALWNWDQQQNGR